MLIDGRNLQENHQLKTEICIIGSGPAGMTIARELIATQYDVILIESGGLEFDSKIQSLAGGKVNSLKQSSLEKSRRRQLGGTSNVWKAPIDRATPGWRCLPLDTEDFKQQDWLPDSGWPFEREDLDPYYLRAHQMCGIGEFDYAVENWEANDCPRLFSYSSKLRTTISQYVSSSVFTHSCPRAIQQAKNIRTLIYSTVVEIRINSTGDRVTNLVVKNPNGIGFKVSAKIFVLATGGIENARLLLLSNNQQRQGLGNQHDLVGRFFMDHPKIELGLFIPFSRSFFNRTKLYDIHQVNGASILGAISLNRELIGDNKIANHAINLYSTYHGHLAQAKTSIEDLKQDLFKPKISKKILPQIYDLIQGHQYLTEVAFWKAWRFMLDQKLGSLSFVPFEKTRFSAVRLVCQMEQAPIRSNRLILSSEKDCLGQSKIELHWQLSNFDLCSLNKIMETIKQELENSGLGTFIQAEPTRCWDFDTVSGYHHLGTTRMHLNPRQGVVDPNCQVHGVNNLFIAGSSVFPTGGYANPTLTIVALAIRLADKIKTSI
jgi:choline dehydrogenase-like flavoprotein